MSFLSSSRALLVVSAIALTLSAIAADGESSSDAGDRDVCASAFFCDDFEKHEIGKLPGAPWKEETYKSGAPISVDTQRSFSGQRALHIEAPKGAKRRGYIAIHTVPVFPEAQHRMFGRIMVWLDSAPVPLDGQPEVHWTLLQGEGRSADDTYNSIYRLGAERQDGIGLKANFETTPPLRTDCRRHSTRRLPVARWTCVEWHFDGPKNEMQYWLDGEALEDIHVRERTNESDSNCSHQDLKGVWLAPPNFQSLYMGLERYDATQNDQHLWIDDVVIAGARVGCPVKPHN